MVREIMSGLGSLYWNPCNLKQVGFFACSFEMEGEGAGRTLEGPGEDIGGREPGKRGGEDK